MNAWATLIVFAEAAPAGSEFPWGTFWTAVGAVIMFVALGYLAGWLPAKYHMAAANPLNDKLTLKIFGPPEISAHSPRLAQVVPRHEEPKYRDDRFKPGRVRSAGKRRHSPELWERACSRLPRVACNLSPADPSQAEASLGILTQRE